MNLSLGIDPGGSGFFVLIDVDSRRIVSSKAIAFSPDKQLLVSEIENWLVGVLEVNEAKITRCCLEEVHAIFGASAKSTFQFGRTFGSLETFLALHGISFRPIQPKKWQKKMWEGVKPIIRGGKVSTKEMSLAAAMKLFPGETFLRTPRCKTPDDNMVDAALLAYYACL